MKLAFISTMADSPWGGSEELWMRTAACALNAGHQVLISVFDWSVSNPKIQALLTKGAELHVRTRFEKSEAKKLPRRILDKMALVVAARTQKVVSPFAGVTKFQPDLLCVSQGGTFDFVYNFFLQELLRTTPYCIVCQHNFENGIMRYEHIQVARKVFTQARHVVFVSNKNYRTAERQISCRLANAGVVFNPLNIKNGDALPFPGKEKRSFACVARMDCSFKGQDILFQVLGDKQWKDRDWELNLYGAGPDEAYLKDLAALYGLSDRIHFRGHVDDIEKVWVVNHIQLMPSISEGTPLALVEAMLCGRPAVVTDVGGNAEMITEGVTGFIAEAASPCSFGKAMEKAWLHAGDWEEYGINAHQYVKKNVDFQPWQTLLGLLTREN